MRGGHTGCWQEKEEDGDGPLRRFRFYLSDVSAAPSVAGAGTGMKISAAVLGRELAEKWGSPPRGELRAWGAGGE